MTDEARDPGLQALFRSAPDLPEDAAFIDSLRLRMKRQGRLRMANRLIVGGLLVAAAFSLQNALFPMSSALLSPLLDIQGLAGKVVAPINSPAGLLSVVLLGVRALHRRVTRG